MQAKTDTILFNVSSIHSNKTGKDYDCIGLIVDGIATNHFLSESTKSLLTSPVVTRFKAGNQQPIKCTAYFDVKCGVKGWRGFLTDLQG